jgi:hypothetical protein
LSVDFEGFSKTIGLDFWVKAVPIVGSIGYIVGLVLLNCFHYCAWGFTDVGIPGAVSGIAAVAAVLAIAMAFVIKVLFLKVVGLIERQPRMIKGSILVLMLVVEFASLIPQRVFQPYIKQHGLTLTGAWRTLIPGVIFYVLCLGAITLVLLLWSGPVASRPYRCKWRPVRKTNHIGLWIACLFATIYVREFKRTASTVKFRRIVARFRIWVARAIDLVFDGLHLISRIYWISSFGIALLALWVLLYVTYQIVPARLGGGRPDQITLLVTENAKLILDPVCPEMRSATKDSAATNVPKQDPNATSLFRYENCRLLHETSDYLILTNDDKDQVVQLSKEFVKARKWKGPLEPKQVPVVVPDSSCQNSRHSSAKQTP